MNIDFNRICKLAGLPNQKSNGLLSESAQHDEGMYYEEEMEEGMHMDEEMEEGMDMDEDMDEEMVEVDVSELMSEIRRAKKIMSENKRISELKAQRKQKIMENKLKRTIAQEVQNVLSEMHDEEYESSWLYGNRKPRHSKKGYTNQGRMIPGIGFRNF